MYIAEYSSTHNCDTLPPFFCDSKYTENRSGRTIGECYTHHTHIQTHLRVDGVNGHLFRALQSFSTLALIFLYTT